MSSSVEDLHPGFSPKDNSSPRTPTSPFGNFVRKRSYPASSIIRDQPGEMAYETMPNTRSEGANDVAHSSRPQYPAASHASPHSQNHKHSPPTPARTHSQSTLSFMRTRQTAPLYSPTGQHVRKMELTFFQRHFTKAVDKDPEKEYKSNNRRFAFLAHGSLITGGIMLLILLGVIAAAVAVTFDHRPQRPTALPNQTSPIRAAVYDNFPDPTIWYNDGTYYAFATNNAAGILQQPKNQTSYEYGTSNIQLAISTDFVTWTLMNSSHDPLPDTGKWVTQGLTKTAPQIPKANVWAPGVIQRPTDNKFVMYYAADRVDAGNASAHHPPPHCVGAAVSETDDPAGPYHPTEDTLVCPVDQGGAIDPAAFKDDDGTLYVAYKVDGNNIGHGGLCGNTKAPIVPTPIMLQKLQADGVTRDGNATTIMDRIKADGPLVEAPALIRSHEGIYFLFFSSGCTRSPTYDIKYATSMSILGPYKRADGPLLQTGDWGLLAPGSAGVHDDGNGGFNMAFHARVQAPQGRIRAMFTTKLEFDGHIARMVRDNSTAT